MQPRAFESKRLGAARRRQRAGRRQPNPTSLDQPPEEAPRSRPVKSPPSRLECWLLRRLLAAIGNPSLSVVLWNGEEIPEAPSPPVARLHVSHRRTLWKLLIDPLFQFGEGYSAAQVGVEGSLADLLVSVNQSLARASEKGPYAAALSRWLRRPRRNTLSASRDNIYYHYDIGNEFYRLWLDEQMVYTCAYFARRSQSLEQAQVDKMEHVCRKLRLQPGETVIEAGCGWGALALHMARQYGVTVRAYNISREQIKHARQRAREEGLHDRVEYIEDDWRNIAGPCDAFVSVGMLEHVGPQNYRRLGDIIHACLKEDGRGLIHTIGQNTTSPVDAWIERRIFPGAYPPTLREMSPIFEPHQFSILDLENLRLHYAETLRHWLDRFERSAAAVARMFDEAFVRMWRLYLAGSWAAFETGKLQLFQVLFARESCNRIPWTRAHQYDHSHAPAPDQQPCSQPSHTLPPHTMSLGSGRWNAATS